MNKILEVKNLKMHFKVGRNAVVKAVDDISFDVIEGETLGLVGESGCGKSTLGRCLVRIYTPTSGQIIFDGNDVTTTPNRQLKQYRRQMQMVFQDPYASLNPRLTVGEIIKEPMDIHNIYDTNEEKLVRVQELLELVGLKPDHIRRYPHEFSGGQRQRIGIARTLALNPKFIVCDEPISALDVSIQAQIINLLEQIQEKTGVSYLFIAHDLSMVKHISHRIGVMYLGKMVEIGSSDELYKDPLHPYSKALLSSVPIPDPVKAKARQRIVLQGELPSPLNPPSGCGFETRCAQAMDECSKSVPELYQVGERKVACFLYKKMKEGEL